MAELWDIYDRDRNKTGRYAERGVYKFKEGEYHLAVSAIILNSKNEILISQRSASKALPLKWEICGGAVRKDEDSLHGVIREVKEELGIEFTESDPIYFKTVARETRSNIKDMWLFRKDVDASKLTLPDGEACDAKWVNIDEFCKICDDGEMVEWIDFDRSDYSTAIEKN